MRSRPRSNSLLVTHRPLQVSLVDKQLVQPASVRSVRTHNVDTFENCPVDGNVTVYIDKSKVSTFAVFY